jgi:branched-chain amino acid transport system substrate-binding protein
MSFAISFWNRPEGAPLVAFPQQSAGLYASSGKETSMRLIIRALIATVLCVVASGSVRAGPPKEITIGALYAGTGHYSSVSVPLHDGLLLWVKEVNGAGGVYVGAYKKRIPVRVVSYDDQGNTATVATLTNELITQDKVNVLAADFGSILTSVSVPIAREHKMLLIDSSGTGTALFSKDNKYVALVGQPAQTVAVRYVAQFLAAEAKAGKLRRLAILYDTNDFTGAEAASFRKTLAKLHAPLKIVFDQGIPTSTADYAVLISRLTAAHPDFVLELGYPSNDIAFLRGLEDTGAHFRGVFANYPGWEPDLIAKDVGVAADKGMFSFMPGVFLSYKTTAGMTASAFHAAWNKAYPKGEAAYGLNAAVGYVEGVVIEQMLAHAPNLSQLGLRQGLYALSGKLVTLQGPFRLAADGEQLGEINALGQVWPKSGGGVTLRAVYPPAVATAKPVFGSP